MLFRKWGCLVGPENSIFRKLKSVDPKNVPLTTEMLLHFYFTFKGFPENERERERARARRRSSGIASSSSSPRSRSTARSRSSRDRAVNRDLDPVARSRSMASRDHGLEIAINDGEIADWRSRSTTTRSRSRARALSLSHFSEILWRENRSVKWFPWSKAFFFGQRISISGK